MSGPAGVWPRTWRVPSAVVFVDRTRTGLVQRSRKNCHQRQSSFAQLRAERPILGWPGDRFIVRSYSPVTTIGGGRVIDVPPRKHRGAADRAVALLTQLDEADGAERLQLVVAGAGPGGLTLPALAARRKGSGTLVV